MDKPNEPDPPPASNDWPRPGDVGYLVAEFDAVQADELNLDGLARELRILIAADPEGRLYYLDSCLSPLGQPPVTAGTPFDAGEVKQTLTESLRESAKKERAYGEKCLSLADTLERLASEGEGEGGAKGRGGQGRTLTVEEVAKELGCSAGWSPHSAPPTAGGGGKNSRENSELPC